VELSKRRKTWGWFSVGCGKGRISTRRRGEGGAWLIRTGTLGETARPAFNFAPADGAGGFFGGYEWLTGKTSGLQGEREQARTERALQKTGHCSGTSGGGTTFWAGGLRERKQFRHQPEKGIKGKMGAKRKQLINDHDRSRAKRNDYRSKKAGVKRVGTRRQGLSWYR